MLPKIRNHAKALNFAINRNLQQLERNEQANNTMKNALISAFDELFRIEEEMEKVFEKRALEKLNRGRGEVAKAAAKLRPATRRRPVLQSAFGT